MIVSLRLENSYQPHKVSLVQEIIIHIHNTFTLKHKVSLAQEILYVTVCACSCVWGGVYVCVGATHTWLSRPSSSSMMKNRIAQKVGIGIMLTALG